MPLLFAALSSLLKVPFFSKPGSRSLAQRSTNPGIIILSFASIFISDLKPSGFFLKATILPSAIKRSCLPSSLLDGSYNFPFSIEIRIIFYSFLSSFVRPIVIAITAIRTAMPWLTC